MAYGTSADEQLVRQFMKICSLSGSEDKTLMTRKSSVNAVKFFWSDVKELDEIDLKAVEETVFMKLMGKKSGMIMVDGPHVEAYITELAHEITKLKRQDLMIRRDDPRVTFTKAFLEKVIRETKIYITGKIEHEEPEIHKDGRGIDRNFNYKKPEFPSNMRKVYDLRHGMPIVIAKRDYGDFGEESKIRSPHKSKH